MHCIKFRLKTLLTLLKIAFLYCVLLRFHFTLMNLIIYANAHDYLSQLPSELYITLTNSFNPVAAHAVLLLGDMSVSFTNNKYLFMKTSCEFK